MSTSHAIGSEAPMQPDPTQAAGAVSVADVSSKTRPGRRVRPLLGTQTAARFRLSDMRCECGSDVIHAVLPGHEGSAEIRNVGGKVLFARVRKRAPRALCLACWAQKHGGPVSQAVAG